MRRATDFVLSDFIVGVAIIAVVVGLMSLAVGSVLVAVLQLAVLGGSAALALSLASQPSPGARIGSILLFPALLLMPRRIRDAIRMIDQKNEATPSKRKHNNDP